MAEHILAHLLHCRWDLRRKPAQQIGDVAIMPKLDDDAAG
jgi:hypothetical protein